MRVAPPLLASALVSLGARPAANKAGKTHTEETMAEIAGGIATSHTPTIGFALDAGKHNDPVWEPIFKGYEPVQQWLADKEPDVL